MRLILSLSSLKECAYDMQYYHKLQGFIYSLIKNTVYEKLHDKNGYKFFCFSNIMPPLDMKEGEKRTIIISSPDSALIKLIKYQIEEKYADNPINIGEYSFELEKTQLLKPKINNNCTLITGTPIIIRIPKENYEKYGIKPKKPYNYVFWRSEYAFEALIKQLEENLIKKYNLFYKRKVEQKPFFEQFILQKEVCNHIIIDGEEHRVFGSLWKFPFSFLNIKKRKLLEFGLDAGFGELNSLGFGFMNVVR